MDKKREVKSRNTLFADKIVTRIWQEIPSELNPYSAKACFCHGYNISELMDKCNFVEVLYLLFRGDLPNQEQSELLQQLMIAFINPGPRHPATRSAMIAGVGKTDLSHLLPISLSILGGNHRGAGCIEDAIRFFRKNSHKNPVESCQNLLRQQKQSKEGDWQPFPGFGSHYGGIDEYTQGIAQKLTKLPAAGKALNWGQAIAAELAAHSMGWVATGLAAAVLSDLGFSPKSGGGLFQLISAPGLLAHGLEMANKPITAMPFPTDEDYTIEE
ncbi:MAG: hypothetical protein KAT62_01320 [Desulfuromonadales bacterium]|nr:hypothetical protein [Desulfuromonadales bacterium]